MDRWLGVKARWPVESFGEEENKRLWPFLLKRNHSPPEECVM